MIKSTLVLWLLLVGAVVQGIVIRKPEQVAEIFYALCPNAASLNLAMEQAYQSDFKRPVGLHVSVAPVRLDEASRPMRVLTRLAFDWSLPCNDVAEICNQLVILDDKNQSVPCGRNIRNPSGYMIDDSFVGFSFPRPRRTVWFPKFKVMSSTPDAVDFGHLMSEYVRVYPFASESQWTGAGPIEAVCLAERPHAFPFDGLNCSFTLEPPYEDAQSVRYALDAYTADLFESGTGDWILIKSSLGAAIADDRRLSFRLAFARSAHHYQNLRFLFVPTVWVVFVMHVASLALPPNHPARPFLSFSLLLTFSVVVAVYGLFWIPRKALFRRTTKVGVGKEELIMDSEPFYLAHLILAKVICQLILTLYVITTSSLARMDDSMRKFSACCHVRVLRAVDCLVATFAILLSVTTDAVYFELINQR